LGTAVDLTIIHKNDNEGHKKKEDHLLGLWDPQSLDMGNVGYLAFDERSWHAFDELTVKQRDNRKLLHDMMMDHEFELLETEFWHYYFSPHRNKSFFFDFDIRDDYRILPNLTLELNICTPF
jgi:D-alanyl-D-alanine dipeptidase